MRILTRYITEEFLKFLGYSLLSFTLLYIIVDLFEKIDRFIDKKISLLILLRYYLYQVPYIAILTLPVAVLLATLFAVGLLARHNELVAMKSSGLSLYRILSPLFSLGLLISLLALICGELVIPPMNRLKASLERKEIEKRPPIDFSQRHNLYYCGTKGRMYYIKFFDGRENRMRDLVIYEFTPQSTLLKRIDAQQAIWLGNHWVFQNGVLRQFEENGEERPPLHFDKLELPDLEETPADFTKQEKDPEEMGFFELREYIGRIKRSGGESTREMVDLFLKISFPFANFIILLFGASLSSYVRRSGTFFGVGVSLFICFLYWGFLQTGRSLGHHGNLSPLLAAWLPNLLFGVAGVIFLYRAGR